jgi:ERCC4-type nuclease
MSAAKSTRARAGALSTAVYMVYDGSREGAVAPFLDDAFPDVKTVPKQITVGDYMICRPQLDEPGILASIERKTWNDFAQGFYDGRYENIQKMKALRAKTGCQLIYIIEGAAFPSPNHRFQRIPARNITAAILKLMVRDGVYVVQTENQVHTAQKLYELCKTFEACILGDTDLDGVGDREAPEAGNGGDNGGNAAPAAAVQYRVPDLATERIEDSDELATIKMWARLTGVSIVLGSVLVRLFSVADLAAGRVTPEAIRAIKTTSGRAIGKDAVDSLLDIRSGAPPACAKLVSGAKGVTPAVAEQVLASPGSLARLVTYSEKTMSLITITQGKKARKLGPALSARLHCLLHYRHGQEEPAPLLAPAAAATGARVPPPRKAAAAARQPDSMYADDERVAVELTDSDLADLGDLFDALL